MIATWKAQYSYLLLLHYHISSHHIPLYSAWRHWECLFHFIHKEFILHLITFNERSSVTHLCILNVRAMIGPHFWFVLHQFHNLELVMFMFINWGYFSSSWNGHQCKFMVKFQRTCTIIFNFLYSNFDE